MKLPTLKNLDVSGINVLVRCDLDVDLDENVLKNKRVNAAVNTLRALAEAKKIIIFGHRGRPEGNYQEDLSLLSLAPVLSEVLGEGVGFVPFAPFLEDFSRSLTQELNSQCKYLLLENLRFWTGEEENSPDFVSVFLGAGEVYVNEAFATSHRTSASIVGLAQALRPRACVGLNFEQEVKHLDVVLQNPRRPVVCLLSGLKADKLDYIQSLTKIADKVILAGRLPEYAEGRSFGTKVIVSHLNPDKEDVTIHAIESIESEFAQAGTIVMAGPVGKFEDPGHMLGTKRTFEAAANSSAYKLAGGGDTATALDMLGLTDKFDWLSTGGGAMLEYLASKTLTGLEAIVEP